MRPNLGHVENVPLVRLRLLGIHNLDKDIPLGVVALLNSLKEVLGVEVRVFARNLGGGLGVEVLDALLGLEVELDVLEAAVLLYLKSLVLDGHTHTHTHTPLPCMKQVVC